MVNVEQFKCLIGKKVKRLIVIVWPPLYENSVLGIDMSVGFEFYGDEELAVKVAIDKSDNWTPIVSSLDVCNEFDWGLFDTRLSGWMEGSIDELICSELYDASSDVIFGRIVCCDVVGVEFLTVAGDFDPFGVKIIFDGDYIIVTPNSDGSTFETSCFNKLSNADNYKSIGDIEHVNLASLIKNKNS